MKFMIAMEGKSIKTELLKYFDYSMDCPTNSSFNQRRAQILPAAFEFLFHEFTQQYLQEPLDIKGYHLVACDGSDINIAHNPHEKDTYFQSNSTEKGFNQLHLNALFDLQRRLYVDAIIQPARLENENKAFCMMLDRYQGSPKTIFIADRGYESYNNIAHVEQSGMYYLIRAKDINSSGILSGCRLPDNDIFDESISFTLTRKCTNEVVGHPEIYKCLHKKGTFDYLDLEDNPFYPLSFRVLRFPISENTYECVITNLPAEEFGIEEIKELYHKRWGIETSFRELKYAVGMTCFHSKKVTYILQEIWARLILYNFCEIITTHVSIVKIRTKHVYQLNYTMAIHICRYFLSKKAEKSPPDVEALIGRELLPVRPGRQDPRKVRSQSAISFLYRAA